MAFLNPVPALLLLGFAATTSQVLVLRQYLVAFYGNELSLGLILSLWLLGHGLGAALSGLLKFRCFRDLRIFLLFLSCAPLLFLPLALKVTIVLLPSLGHLVPLHSVLVGASLLVLPLGALMGLPFPALCGIYANRDQGGESEIALFYAADALGSMIGGMAYSFLFARLLQPVQVAALCGLALSVTALGLRQPRIDGNAKGTYTVYLSALAAVLVFALLSIPRLSDPLQKRLAVAGSAVAHPDLAFVAQTDTPYQHLLLASSHGQYDLFADGRYCLSFPDIVTVAQEAHFSMLLHPNPGKVVILGGGLNGFCKQALTHHPDELVYVELDGDKLDFLMPYLPAEDKAAMKDERLSLVRDDGRRYLSGREDASIDLLLLRLPEPQSAMLNRYYTLEFFQLVRRKLARGGIFVCASTGSANYLGKEVSEYVGTLLATLEAAFDKVMVLPGDHCLYIAGDGSAEISLDVDVLGKRFAGRSVHSDYFSPLHVKLLVDPYRVRDFQEKRRSLPTASLNRDFAPTAYFHNLVLWNIFSQSGLGSLLEKIRNLTLFTMAAMLSCLILLAGVFILLFRSSPFGAACSMMSFMAFSGAASMVFHITVMLAYQNVFGCLYERLGLAVALFMAGLACGGLIGRSLLKRKPNLFVCLTAAKLASVVAVLLLPCLLEYPGASETGCFTETLFLSLIFCGGFVPGMEYALAAALAVQSGFDPGRASGMIHGGDVIGGALGACCSALVLVPVLGFAASLRLLALLHFGAWIHMYIGGCHRNISA